MGDDGDKREVFDDDMRRYERIRATVRAILLVVVFIVLHKVFSRWVLDPLYQSPTDAADRVQQEMNKNCPPGAICSMAQHVKDAL
jgi:hypothetical protein